MKCITLTPANKGATLTAEARERLQQAWIAARRRHGLPVPTQAIGPISLAHLLAALLRRLGIGGAA